MQPDYEAGYSSATLEALDMTSDELRALIAYMREYLDGGNRHARAYAAGAIDGLLRVLGPYA